VRRVILLLSVLPLWVFAQEHHVPVGTQGNSLLFSVKKGVLLLTISVFITMKVGESMGQVVVRDSVKVFSVPEEISKLMLKMPRFQNDAEDDSLYGVDTLIFRWMPTGSFTAVWFLLIVLWQRRW